MRVDLDTVPAIPFVPPGFALRQRSSSFVAYFRERAVAMGRLIPGTAQVRVVVRRGYRGLGVETLIAWAAREAAGWEAGHATPVRPFAGRPALINCKGETHEIRVH